MADLENFIPAIKYGHTGGRLLTNTVVGDLTFDSNGTATFSQGMPFIASTSFGSASFGTTATLGSGATILADASVTQGRKVYPMNFFVKMEGVSTATGWNSDTMTSMGYNITDGSGGTFFSFGTDMTKSYEFGIGQVMISTVSNGSMSVGTAFYRATGGTASKGLKIVSNGTVSAATGTMWVTVYGFIK